MSSLRELYRKWLQSRRSEPDAGEQSGFSDRFDPSPHLCAACEQGFSAFLNLLYLGDIDLSPLKGSETCFHADQVQVCVLCGTDCGSHLAVQVRNGGEGLERDRHGDSERSLLSRDVVSLRGQLLLFRNAIELADYLVSVQEFGFVAHDSSPSVGGDCGVSHLTEGESRRGWVEGVM